MDLTPEQKIAQREQHEAEEQLQTDVAEAKAIAQENDAYYNDAIHLATVVIPELAHEVARTMCERDSEFEKAQLLSFTVTPAKLYRRAVKKRIAAWRFSANVTNVLFVFLTREGEIVKLSLSPNQTRRIELDTLSYTELKSIQSGIEDLESDTFFLEDLEKEYPRLSE